MDKPQSSQNAKECKILDNERCQQQRGDDDQIRNCVDAHQISSQVLGNPEARGNVDQDEHT